MMTNHNLILNALSNVHDSSSTSTRSAANTWPVVNPNVQHLIMVCECLCACFVSE